MEKATQKEIIDGAIKDFIQTALFAGGIVGIILGVLKILRVI